MPAKLYSPPHRATASSLLWRVAFIGGILMLTVGVLWLERDQLIDHTTRTHPDLVGIIYFTMVTVTTVGYGDIVPVTAFSRLVDTLFLVPIRFIVLFTFLGTAYGFVLRRLEGRYRMQRTVDKLDGHIIICGYGATARAAVRELLSGGHPPDQIVALDTDELALERAVGDGVIAIEGDATEEAVLRKVAVERATHIIICPGRDDSTVLIALTAHDLNPEAHIVATVRMRENIKLLQRSGAQTIVSPATAGGTLMAAATRHAHLVDTMLEILSVGGSMRVEERGVRSEEVGQRPSDIAGLAVVRVYRNGTAYDVGSLPVLEEGDTLVAIVKGV